MRSASPNAHEMEIMHQPVADVHGLRVHRTTAKLSRRTLLRPEDRDQFVGAPRPFDNHSDFGDTSGVEGV